MVFFLSVFSCNFYEPKFSQILYFMHMLGSTRWEYWSLSITQWCPVPWTHIYISLKKNLSFFFQEHHDDILAAAFSAPHTLATASYDGEIIIWNSGSEVASRHLRQRYLKKVVKSRAGTRLVSVWVIFATNKVVHTGWVYSYFRLKGLCNFWRTKNTMSTDLH